MSPFDQTRFPLPRGARADAVPACGVSVVVALGAEGQRLIGGGAY